MVLAFAELPVVWAEIIGRPEEEIIALLAEFYLSRDDLLQLSGLPGGVDTLGLQLEGDPSVLAVIRAGAGSDRWKIQVKLGPVNVMSIGR